MNHSDESNFLLNGGLRRSTASHMHGPGLTYGVTHELAYTHPGTHHNPYVQVIPNEYILSSNVTEIQQ